MEPQARTFGRYRLLEIIGAGGMAEVFLAKLEGIEGFERRLAIKRILPHYSKNESFVRMFIDEARLVGHFSHPNIVQIFDFGKIDDSYYISMEYVEGINLADILTRYKAEGKTIPLEVILEIGIQACRGIDYAHKETDEEGKPLGIIHRDLTPHNILVSRKGVVKITDFGIAKASMNTHLTQAGMIKGKVPYMSPEQAMGMPLTHVSDIFAIGIVMYEMCTLRRLFEGENDFTILRKVQEAKIPSISEQNKSIPEELERIIMRALTRDRADRYQWAAEMEMELTRLKFSYGSLFQQFSLADFIQGFIQSRQQAKQASTQAAMQAPASTTAQPAREPDVAESLSAIAADLSGIEDPLGKMRGTAGDDSDKKTVMLSTAPDGQILWPEPGQQGPKLEPLGPASSGTKSGETSSPETAVASGGLADEDDVVPSRRRYGLIGGIAAAVAVAAGVLVFLLMPRTGSLLVEVTPPDAEIFVNGEKVSTSSPFLRQDLPEGETLTVKVHKDGFKDVSQTVTIKSGVRSKLPVKLTKETAAVASYGFLLVNSEPPGARVLLKGQDTGLVTPCKLNLAPDVPYDLTFQLEGKESRTGSYQVASGEQKMVKVDFSAPGTGAPPAVDAPAAEAGNLPASTPGGATVTPAAPAGSPTNTTNQAPPVPGAAPVGTPATAGTSPSGQQGAAPADRKHGIDAQANAG